MMKIQQPFQLVFHNRLSKSVGHLDTNIVQGPCGDLASLHIN